MGRLQYNELLTKRKSAMNQENSSPEFVSNENQLWNTLLKSIIFTEG